MSDSLRIVRLIAENFKRIKLVDITPKGDLIQITGRNGSGKSSLLDAIMCAVAGRGNAPAKPIRDGADQATIRVDLGEYEVTRVFTKEDKQPPILVRPKNGGAGMKGKPLKSAQDLLDKLYGDLTFDPLAFARMPAKYQYEELRKIAGLGTELDDFDALNKIDYEERTRWNKLAKEARAAAKDIEVPEGLPDVRVNVAVLADEMEKATAHNAGIATRRAGREQAVKRVQDLRERSAKLTAEWPVEVQRINARRDERIAELQRQIDAVTKQAAADVRAIEDKASKDTELLQSEAAQLQHKLDHAEPLPEPKDVLAFKEQIANAQSINSGIDLRERRAERMEEADRHEKRSKELTEAMDTRTEQKRAMIEGAKMPVKGLGIEDGQVTYKNIPFEQCSSAEQLRVSVAIAMAANPTLRILRIKDGSLLDSANMQVIAEMCETHNFQAWIECVDETGEVGIVLEDGAVVADNTAKPKKELARA